MENPRDSYKSQIKDYVCSLDIEATKKKQIYIALNGGIYSSLKEKKGKGTRTMYFEDGTKQNVNTYEGRFKAISKILGDDLENSQELYKMILENNYNGNSKNKALKENATKKYLEVKEMLDQKANSSNHPTGLEGAVIAGCDQIKENGDVSFEEYSKPVFETEGSFTTDYSTISQPPVKKRSLLRKAISFAGVAVLGSVFLLEGSCGDSKYNSNKTNTGNYSNQENVSPLVVQDVQEKKQENHSKQENPSPKNDLVEVSTLEKPNNDFSSLEELLDEEKTSHLNDVFPSAQILETSKNEIIDNQAQEIQLTSTNQNSSQKYCVIKDLQKYVDHTTARNAQIRDGELSINPLHLVKQTGNNFVPLKEEVTDFSSVGYSNEDFSNRTKGVKSGFKKIGNGLQKLVSLGFWDSRKEEEKTNEGNQVLRFLKSPYDVLIGAVQTTVNSADYIAAGVLGKTLNTTIDATRGVVGTTVSATNYICAVPFYPLDKAEKLFHENTYSQKTYETVLSLARFGGNVLSHEVPERGKTIEIISNDGKKVVLDKGEIGATLELITGLGLDYLAVSKLFEDGGSSHSNGSGNGNGGGNPSNGGIVIVPGNGGSVGGGM